jgi:stringent starvation protein B
VLLAFLERGVAMVHLDARRPGVSVPQQYRDEAHLRLNLSYRYGILDFEIGDDEVRATLAFGGRSFRCVLPWDAIFGITSQTSGDGQVWPEDLPVEVATAGEAPPSRENGAAAPARFEQRQRRPSLAAVESDPPRSVEDDRSTPPDAPPRRHLRLVR